MTVMGNELLTPPHTITFRTYREGDEHGIIRLRKEVTGKDMSLKEWYWKFKGQGNEKVFSIVMEETTHGIIGHWGGIPLKMLHDGREMTGVAGCNVMIHPKFRSFVRFKKLHNLFVQEFAKDSVTFIYGFPTEKTFMLPAEKLGLWERIEDINESVKDVRFHSRPVRFLFKFLPIDFNDGRIDTLWNDVKYQFDLSIIKDAAYLNWRYEKNPRFKYEIWGLWKRWYGNLIAFVVIKREESENFIIMDMVFRKGMLPVLLSKVEDLAYSMSKSSLRLFMPQRFTSFLKERGFSSRLTGGVIARANDPRLLKKDEIEEKFFYTMGDTDYI